jgi:hypothetical protein
VLTQLTDSDLQFLSRLATNPEFQPLTSLLSRELSSHDAKCRILDGPALYRSQGVSAWLVDFAATIAGATEELGRRAQDRARRPLRAGTPTPERSVGIQ